MIFPPRLTSRVSRRTALLRRPSHAEAVTAESAAAPLPVREVAPVSAPRRARNYPARSFAAQLLELGLNHGIEALVRKADDAANDHVRVDDALRLYEQAQDDFIDERAAMFLRFRA